jgi:rubredoxin
MTMASKINTGRTQELADVISNILDLWDDDALPLALEKMKIYSIDAMVDYNVEDIEDMVYDEDDGFEADGITPKYKTEPLPDGYKALMKIFKTYVDFEMEVNDLNLRNDWSKLDSERFNDYRYTMECTYRVKRLDNSRQRTTRAAKALELPLMLKNILDQADDDPIPLAVAKKKVNSINDLVDLEPADFHAMVYDEEDGFEDDGVTPKYKSEELPCGSRTLLKIFKTYVHYESEVNGLNL